MARHSVFTTVNQLWQNIDYTVYTARFQSHDVYKSSDNVWVENPAAELPAELT